VEETVVSETSSAADVSVSMAFFVPEEFKGTPSFDAGSETMASNAAALCSKGIPGSGIGTGSNIEEASALAVFAPGSPPKRTAASCAFVFQSARRKRSAAVLYHFAASALFAEVSKYFANSKATMASWVFSYSAESWPAGSLEVLARRMRAVICFQSAIKVPAL
jgi:hypothetical protein